MPHTGLLATIALLLLLTAAKAQQNCTCDAYEPNYSFATAAEVTDAFNATICPELDVDYFLIGNSSTSSYLGVNITSDSDDLWCDLYVALVGNDTSTNISTSNTSATNDTSPFPLVTSLSTQNGTASVLVSVPAGDYFLKCYARHPSSNDTSGIIYSVTTEISEGLCPTDIGESNNVRAAAYNITLPQAALTAELCPDAADVDWYHFFSVSYETIRVLAKASSAEDFMNDTEGDFGLVLTAWNPRGDRYTLLVPPAGLNVSLELMPGDYYFQFQALNDTDSVPTVYTFSTEHLNDSCVPSPSSAGSSIATATALGNSTEPANGSFCPVDSVFYVFFNVTADSALQDYQFIQPNSPPPTLTLLLDGEEVGNLLARQIPGAAAGGFTTDRTLLPPGRYVIRTQGAGFTAYNWTMSLLQSNSSTWVQGAATPPAPDIYEPNDNQDNATLVTLPFNATLLNLFPSFDADWFQFDLTEPTNLFVSLSSFYPVTENPMSPFFTSLEDQAKQAVAAFYDTNGTLLASHYMDEQQFTFAQNVGPGEVFMKITPGLRAPGHVVWQYNVTVESGPAIACGQNTSEPSSPPPPTGTAAPSSSFPSLITSTSTGGIGRQNGSALLQLSMLVWIAFIVAQLL